MKIFSLICVKFTQIMKGNFDFIHQFFSSYIGREFAWKARPNSLNLKQIYIR